MSPFIATRSAIIFQVGCFQTITAVEVVSTKKLLGVVVLTARFCKVDSTVNCTKEIVIYKSLKPRSCDDSQELTQLNR